MLKRTLLAIAVFSVAAVPMAYAQGFPGTFQPGQYQTQPNRIGPQQAPWAQQPAPHQHTFRTGQRLGNCQTPPPVTNHRHLGLNAPGQNQRWVRIDSQYALINVLTGVIVRIATAR